MGTQVEIRISDLPNSSRPPGERHSDPYRGVILVLLAAAVVGAAAAVAGGVWLGNRVLFELSITLGLATGVLLGVALARRSRSRLLQRLSTTGETEPTVETPTTGLEELPAVAESLEESATATKSKMSAWLQIIRSATARWFGAQGSRRIVGISTASLAIAATAILPVLDLYSTEPPTLLASGLALLGCLVGAGLAAAAARYLSEVDPTALPEAPGLTRGARLASWTFVLAGAAVVLVWARQETLVWILGLTVVGINIAICYGLVFAQRPADRLCPEGGEVFSTDLGVLYVLGNRANMFGSILDAGERQLGIDLRATWALTVVRQSLEPLVIGLVLLGWLSTSLTVVGLQEQGLVERLGVPLAGQPLTPGLHLHWPWPIDQVFRVPVLRVQSLTVGHEGEEEGGGPENVLWTVQHAANEYTLLLGDGRDLITIDATVQYRIRDPRAWRYQTQNPADALKAIAYRAVMRNTVNRTLNDALSENITTLTATMRGMIQKDADDMGLGVDVLGFTIGGMHPPVPVADAYEAVVSAQLGNVTAVVNAQAFRNQVVPEAEAAALTGQNNARADGAQALGVAAGQAWAFRGLESQYRTAPEEYRFRQRIEALEKALTGHRFTVVDSRFLRDGGELWLTQ